MGPYIKISASFYFLCFSPWYPGMNTFCYYVKIERWRWYEFFIFSYFEILISLEIREETSSQNTKVRLLREYSY